MNSGGCVKRMEGVQLMKVADAFGVEDRRRRGRSIEGSGDNWWRQ